MLKVTLQVAIQRRSLRYMTALFSDVVSWAYEIRAVAVCIHHSMYQLFPVVVYSLALVESHKWRNPKSTEFESSHWEATCPAQ